MRGLGRSEAVVGMADTEAGDSHSTASGNGQFRPIQLCTTMCMWQTMPLYNKHNLNHSSCLDNNSIDSFPVDS